jgi:hypothetical protein
MDTVCSGSGGLATRSSRSQARLRGKRRSRPKGPPPCSSERQPNLGARWSGGASACPDRSAFCVPPHAPWAAAPCGLSVWATAEVAARGWPRRCDRRWRRQIRRFIHRRRRIRSWDGLGLGHLRPWRDLLRRRWRSNREGREIDRDGGRRSVRRRFGVAPVEGRPSRGEMDRSHNDRRRAPAKRSKRRLSSRRPAISALRHGRGASFIGPGAGAPAALGPVAPFDWPVSSSPTNAIFR